jgi:LAS superfamily LD-carboxypeptidase LdcB
MKIGKTLIALVAGLLLILSGNGQAFAPVTANLPQQGGFEGEIEPLGKNPELVVDGAPINLTKLFNSEIPLFNGQDLGIFSSAATEINAGEKRVNITFRDAVIGFQFLNASLSRTENSLALKFKESAQAVLVVTAPGLDIVNDSAVEVTTGGQGKKRVCYLLDLQIRDGRVVVKDMRRVLFPGKTAGYNDIVSAQHTLTENYVPANLIPIPASVPAAQSKHDMKLNKEAAANLEKMLLQAQNEGVGNFSLSSTYRPYSYQSMLFANKVKQVGSEQQAARIVARPGTSEHQSGLAIDFSTSGMGLTENFASTPQGQWLGKNAWRYGFILRYPANKTDITKIIYEPWHFRYVGYPYSKIMYDRKLCLEEYTRNLKEYGFYTVSDQSNTFVVTFNPGDNKIYLSEAVPKFGL